MNNHQYFDVLYFILLTLEKMSGFAPLPRLSPGNLTTVCLGVIAQHFACNGFMRTVGCDVKGIDPMGRCQIDNTSMARNIGCPVLKKHMFFLL